MSIVSKTNLMRWFEEVWNQERLEVVDELLAAGCTVHDNGCDIRGTEEFKIFIRELRGQFPEIHVTLHEAIREGDLECMRWTAMFRQARTHKTAYASGMTMVRISGGRFAEVWQNWDLDGLIQQLR